MLTNEESREIGGGLKFCHARVIRPLLPPPPSVSLSERRSFAFPRFLVPGFQRVLRTLGKNPTLDLWDGNWPGRFVRMWSIIDGTIREFKKHEECALLSLEG